MSNIFRPGDFEENPNIVHIPLRSGISAERSEDGARQRLAIRTRMARQAGERMTEAQATRVEILRTTQEEAAAILAKAREQAGAIVAGAKKEQQRIETAAKESGTAIAKQEARAASLLLVESSLKTLEAAAADVRSLKLAYMRSGADGMAQIIGAILERLLRGPVVVDDKLVLRTIDHAINEITAVDRLTLRIHPDDLTASSEYKNEMMNKIENLMDIVIIPDAGITRGGVLVETAFGRVDARLETQLSEYLRDLRTAAANFSPMPVQPEQSERPSSSPASSKP